MRWTLNMFYFGYPILSRKHTLILEGQNGFPALGAGVLAS